MRTRVLHCIETIGSGGVEQRRVSLAKYLDRERFEQQVVCSYVIGDFNLKLENLGVPVIAIGGLYHLFNLRYYFRLLKVIINYKPHIIHGAVFEGVVSAVVGGLFFRIPAIIIEETSDPKNRSWRGNLLMKILSVFAHYVVGISPSVVNYLRITTHISESKVRLINNGVEEPTYPVRLEIDTLKKSLRIAPDDFIVGTVGRLKDSVKRFSDLIRAIALVKSEIPAIKLLIVGDGVDREMLAHLASNLGVADKVIFAGFQKETSMYYGCMDLFALASDTEGFGLVLVEAMFFKLPVIATAVGGMRDIVMDGTTGILVDRHSPSDFARAIERLWADVDLSKKMGQLGYERAIREYSARTYARKVEELYREVCSDIILRGHVHKVRK